MTIIGQKVEKKHVQVDYKKVLSITKIIFWIVVALVVAVIALTVMKYISLENKTQELSLTATYPYKDDILNSSVGGNSTEQKKQFMSRVRSATSLGLVMNELRTVTGELKEVEGILADRQLPYTYLLSTYFFPKINIWKNEDTNTIDSALIGQRFLDENPYLDINLISKWTEFFKDIGANSQANNISSFQLGKITEEQETGIFTLSLDVQFESSTKRAFLLLVDKIGLTSNKENIGLLNEFFYHLWLVLREKHSGGLVADALSDEQSDPLATNESGEAAETTTEESQPAIDPLNQLVTDIIIGAKIREWVDDPTSTFIEEEDILKAIHSFAGCSDGNAQVGTQNTIRVDDRCLFLFRQKSQTIPSFAYSVGLSSSNKVRELRRFIAQLPPLMEIDGFTFNKTNPASSRNAELTRGFEGSISVEVYGRGISAGDLNEIATFLGSQCIGQGIPLSTTTALQHLDRSIREITQISTLTNERSRQFNELRSAFQEIEKEYTTLPGFQKVIKIFEIYRMLEENRLCLNAN